MTMMTKVLRFTAVAVTVLFACQSKPGTAASGEPSASTSKKKVNTKGLAFTLSLTRGERSKDSNSRSSFVELKGDKVTFAGPHPPCVRGRCGRGKVTFDLNQATYDRALKTIARDKLIEAVEERKPTEDRGSYVRASLTLTLSGKSSKTSVVGMTRSMSNLRNELSEQARKRAGQIESLLYIFKSSAPPLIPSK